MLLWLLAGVALLFGGLWLVRWFVAADPRTLMFAAKSVAAALLVVVVGVLALSGRAGWLLALLPLLLPIVLRRSGWGSTAALGGLSGGSRQQTSNVRTRFFDMRLDHENGELDGDVREGRHAGRPLSDLSLADLLRMLSELRTIDRESARLLEAYLDRRDADWRARAEEADEGGGSGREEASAGPSATMTAEEAYRVLGLASDASDAEIKEAYHRLIGGVHPDKGGSAFLAAQVNRAKDVLLRGRDRGGR